MSDTGMMLVSATSTLAVLFAGLLIFVWVEDRVARKRDLANHRARQRRQDADRLARFNAMVAALDSRETS